MSDNQRRTAPPAPAKRRRQVQRGRVPANQPLVPSRKSYNLNAPPAHPKTVTISTDHSDLSSNEDANSIKRRRRDESLQSRRYRRSATRARRPPKNILPRQVLCNAINTEVIRLTRQLEDGNRRDRSTKDVSKWCTQRSNASTAVTKFIGKYFLDMKLIRSLERLKFAQACVLCLHPYCGNRPTFDVADAMWRMLRALELDLAMSKECGVYAVFQYWHDKNIYFKLVRKIALEVEKRLMDMRCVLVGEGRN
ncbi:hypothetical protein B9Z19DRAFT_1074394 [Tuber borchii]|uniref:Uncharacterized protein n=1 Tax=Tuber borchii TaxID=42251 RepID=A0A2T7A4K1_TUBBO|nr:hypothetical protein B9Z19DRAFT_1074394 [Tuber borchii]